MRYRGILKIFLIISLMMALLNCSYADSGPEIGSNEVKKMAQDYLDSHNLPYTAVTPNDRAKDLVMDIKTYEMEWIPNGEWDGSSALGPAIVYEVPVNNNNGKLIGKIYIQAIGMEGTIIEVILLPTSKTDANNFILPDGTPYSGNNTNISIVTSLTPQKSSNNNIEFSDTTEETFFDTTTLLITFIIGISIGLVVGVGYSKLIRRR